MRRFGVSGEGRRTGLLVGVTVVAGLLAAWWVGSAARVANEGFDITDEGYYLLSYRWWNHNPLAFSGVQYLYGPVFEWLDWDIVRLRLFRLLTVVVVHLAFGYSFMRWLRVQRPTAPPTRLWELAGTAVVLAAGGLSYAWLPLSPGYNDVVLLGALTLAACVLWMATAVDRGRRVPFWLPMVAGLVIAAMVLAKWASVVVVGVILIAAVVVLAGQGWKAVARGTLFLIGGLLLTAIVLQLFVIRLNVAVPAIVTVNSFIAGTSYSPPELLDHYWTTGIDLLGRTLRAHGLLLVAAIVAVIARRRRLRIVAAVLVTGGFVLSVWRVVDDHAARGGSRHIRDYAVTLLAAFLVALVVAVAAAVAGLRSTDRPRPSHGELRMRFILGALALVPLLQSVGTNNALYTIGFNAFAAWAAIMVAVATSAALPALARLTVGAVAGASLVAVTSIAYTGLFRFPYRSFPHAELTTTTRLAPLKGLHLWATDAHRYTVLHSRLKPYLQTGRPILALDKMAGLVLMLDGRPVGEAWISPAERQRTASGIEEACRTDRPWDPGPPPLIITNRPIADLDVTALQVCQLDFRADYVLLAPARETSGVQVWVPKAELVATP